MGGWSRYRGSLRAGVGIEGVTAGWSRYWGDHCSLE